MSTQNNNWRVNNLPKDVRGSLNGRWKGGIHHRKDGYILVRVGIVSRTAKGARYKLKHRIIMEGYLGRPLLKSEIVHHKNGDPSDNRIENLEIMTQSKHIKLHLHHEKEHN